jgi:hypothetical protein
MERRGVTGGPPPPTTCTPGITPQPRDGSYRSVRARTGTCTSRKAGTCMRTCGTTQSTRLIRLANERSPGNCSIGRRINNHRGSGLKAPTSSRPLRRGETRQTRRSSSSLPLLTVGPCCSHTPFGDRRIDIQVSMDGKVLGGIETKTGNSRYTTSQRVKDWWLRTFENYIVNVVREVK